MRVIGVDVSLGSTGFAAVEQDGTIQTCTISPPRDTDFFRQCAAVGEIAARVQDDDVVVLEDFGVSARFAQTGKFIERVELVGMLKLVLSRKTNKPVIQCSPNHLKMFVTGKGSSPKSEVVRSVKTAWAPNVANDDEADAVGLAMVGGALVFRSAMFCSRVSAALLQKIMKWRENELAVSRARFFLPKTEQPILKK